MKNLIIFFLLILFECTIACAQKIINKGIYKANFSNTLHQPRWVSYKLYKGGGDCDRDGMNFKCDEAGLECATDEDYAHSGYDKGHLANAEDFASDCDKDELTFRYYNCLPQTVNLNRGIWKRNETEIRKWSQDEKLYIICGGFFGSKKVGNSAVPNYCWKVVQSVKTKKVLFCGWFKNSTPAKLDTLTIPELEAKLNSKIKLLK
jgi:endonuclease G, mitochondrial